MKKNKYFIKEKQYKKAYIRLNEILEEISKLPSVKLEKPIQVGWEVFYDLRDDIKRKPDYMYIKQAFDIFYQNHTTIIKNPKWVSLIRKEVIITSKRNKILDKKTLYFIKNFNNLDEKVKKYIIFSQIKKKYYLNFPDYFFKLKVRPNIHYYKKIINGELISEKEKLWNFLYNNIKSPYYCNFSKTYPTVKKERVILRNFIQKLKKKEIDDIESIFIKKEYIY